MRIKTLKEFPFHLFTQEISLSKEKTKEFFKTYKLTHSIMSQAYAYIASLNNFKYTTEGLIDGSVYLKDNFPRDPWGVGFYLMLMTEPRGNLFPGIKQIDKNYKSYCGLVPLIMAAHKLLNGISYESWDKTTLKQIVNKSLLEVMELATLPYKYQFTAEELLNARDYGLVVRSGSSEGKNKRPETTFNLTGLSKLLDSDCLLVGGDFVEELPTLAQTILTQIWAAHPINRTELMILDLYNWDSIPEPLEHTEILLKADNYNKPNIDPWTNKDVDRIEIPWD